MVLIIYNIDVDSLSAEVADNKITATLAGTPPFIIFETGSRHNQGPASHIASNSRRSIYLLLVNCSIAQCHMTLITSRTVVSQCKCTIFQNDNKLTTHYFRVYLLET